MQCVIGARSERRIAHTLYFFVLMCKVFGQRTSNGNGYQQWWGRQLGRFLITLWRKTRILRCWFTRLGHFGTVEISVEQMNHSTHWTRFCSLQGIREGNFKQPNQLSRSRCTGNTHVGSHLTSDNSKSITTALSSENKVELELAWSFATRMEQC